MEELKLIEAKTCQASQIHRLIKRVLDVYQLYHLRPPGVDDDIDHLEADYLDNNGSFWVLVDTQGEIVGSCGLFKINSAICELRKMYLDQRYQGKGYGKKMLLQAIATASEKGYEAMSLKTNSNLKEALKLYQKYGFEHYNLTGEDQKEDCDTAMVLYLQKASKSDT